MLVLLDERIKVTIQPVNLPADGCLFVERVAELVKPTD
jgi:hypothetical protein